MIWNIHNTTLRLNNMKIEIMFDSIWGNSFLDGSNNEPLPKGGRKYVCSCSNLNEKSYLFKDITLNTIMGVMNRLVGEQDKLYKIRQREDYYLRDIDELLTEEDIVVEKTTTDEVVYLRNLYGEHPSLCQGIKNNFNDIYSRELFSVLYLNKEELIEFLLNEDYTIKLESYIDIDTISNRLEEDDYKKLKFTRMDNNFDEIVSTLKSIYSVDEAKKFDVNILKDKDVIKLKVLYCTSLYIQLERMKKKYNFSSEEYEKMDFISKSGLIRGVSKNSITLKDLRESFGLKKMNVRGNPYVIEGNVKNSKSITEMKALRKSDGKVTINLNISEDRARDLYEKILKAGVTSFYLGKKGLAYISNIEL